MAVWRNERGQSVTVFFAVVVMALLALCGLVVDGGRQAAATREAQGVAATVARAAADAAAGDAVAGDGPQAGSGPATGQRLLAQSGMSGTVTPVAGGVRVDTATNVPTVFLSLVGISSLPARGSATAAYQVVG